MIALATSWKHSDLTPDDQLLIEPLANLGMPAQPRIWDDPRTDWTACDAVVIRSCWDYHLRAAEFQAWLRRLAAAGVAVWNPPEAIRWNHDKRYLKELAEQGVATVPTLWVDEGERPDWKSLLERAGWNRIVVKPTVSASAHGTHLLEHPASSESIAILDRSAREHAVMVQPYLPEIETGGEWSLMFFGGEFSHAVLKRPAPGDFRTLHEFGGSVLPRDPAPALVQPAAQVLATLPWPLLYARSDWVETAAGPLLVELELIEPVLFFESAPDAPARFAARLRSLLGST